VLEVCGEAMSNLYKLAPAIAETILRARLPPTRRRVKISLPATSRTPLPWFDELPWDYALPMRSTSRLHNAAVPTFSRSTPRWRARHVPSASLRSEND
jgi:hypothetical protein